MASLRRLAADHAALHKTELPPYYLFPAAGAAAVPDDLTHLNILLAGPPGTPYAEGLWRLNLRIPHDYPASPPKAFFKTKIWHPNVDESTGSVCLDTLKRDWQPSLTLRDILITISCLIINPNPDSALNSAAGKLLQESWESFARQAKLMTGIHARCSKNLEAAVRQARTRGEEQELQDDDMSEAEDDSKENDASMAPAATRPLTAPRRPVLGKRPLAELPIPVEVDENAQEDMTSSARNIAANTPNLSNSMASFGIKSVPATASNPLAARVPSPPSPSRQRPVRVTQDPFMDAMSDLPDTACTMEPAAKRVRPMAEKSTGTAFAVFVEPEAPKSLWDLPFDATLPAGLGLGVLNGRPAGASGVTKLNATAAKTKPRVGLRRL